MESSHSPAPTYFKQGFFSLEAIVDSVGYEEVLFLPQKF
jgi:hypothetical protein